MEDEFWPLEQMEIPNSNDTVWIVRRGWILIVRRNGKFGKLRNQQEAAWQQPAAPLTTSPDQSPSGHSSNGHPRKRRPA